MSFSKRLLYFMVHTLGFTNKEAKHLLEQGRIKLDGNVALTNCLLDGLSEISVDNTIKRAKKSFIYLKFNKPAGFESTLNEKIADNLSGFFKDFEQLFIAGRLDKQSEGLLLLSNDGKWVETLCNPKFEKEKEYEVTLDKEADQAFADQFMLGVRIGSYVTQPCLCRLMGDRVISVTLREGKNRQIRKMCRTLGYQVIRLNRRRIGQIFLNDLPLAAMEPITGLS